MSNNEYDQQLKAENCAQSCAQATPEPTPMEQVLVERQAALVLKLAMEIFLQVPSFAAADAINEAAQAYHEAWIRGRKRVL